MKRSDLSFSKKWTNKNSSHLISYGTIKLRVRDTVGLIR